MYARVQTVHKSREELDTLARLAGEQLAAAPDLPGFTDLFYLVDRDHEKALVISLWETEADLRRLEANNEAVRERVKAEAQLDSPPAEVFEVAFRS